MAFSMVLLFGCFAFAAGIATVIAAARSGRAGESWGALLLEGLLGIARRRDRAALARVDRAGVRLDDRRLGDRDRRAGDRERDQAAQDHRARVAAGDRGRHCRSRSALLMFYRPLAGGVAVVWWLGAYALLFGVMMIVLGFRLRGLQRAPAAASFRREDWASAPDGSSDANLFRSPDRRGREVVVDPGLDVGHHALLADVVEQVVVVALVELQRLVVRAGASRRSAGCRWASSPCRRCRAGSAPAA